MPFDRLDSNGAPLMTAKLVRTIKRLSNAQPGLGPWRTQVPGVAILRSETTTPAMPRLTKPVICFVGQGAKWSEIGGRPYDIRAGMALVVGVETQALGRIAQASPELPFLGLAVELDQTTMREMAVAQSVVQTPHRQGGGAILLTKVEGPLSDSLTRLVGLVDTPAAVPVLYTSIMREICYWLLNGPAGGELAHLTSTCNETPRVVAALHHVRERFCEPLRVDELASLAQMSVSAFHRRFKAMTNFSPLQFQKRVRLLEARRLMLSDSADAGDAAFRVGYKSASQFSREYTRMFGSAPKRDVRKSR